MTDKNKNVENVDLHDAVDTNDIVEETLDEAQEPKGTAKTVDAPDYADAVDSVDKAADAGTTAKARPTDKKNSEKSHLPKTKAGLISAMYQKLNGMQKQDLTAAYSKMMEDADLADAEVVAEDVDTNVELQSLVDSEATLSEEFKEKTAVIFESAIRSKLSEEVDRLEEQYKEELSEEVSSIKADLVEKVDSYLNYVVETWMEDNKLAVQNGLRTEVAENFMEKMKDLFVESYIEVPESKVDLVDELAEQVTELEESLNTRTGEAIKLSEQLDEYKRNAVIAEAARGLADTQAEKLKSLAEGTVFEDEQSFASKLAIIKESHFNKPQTVVSEDVEDDAADTVQVSAIMENYLNAIRKTSK